MCLWFFYGCIYAFLNGVYDFFMLCSQVVFFQSRLWSFGLDLSWTFKVLVYFFEIRD